MKEFCVATLPEGITNNEQRHVLVRGVLQYLVAPRLNHITIGKNQRPAIEPFLSEKEKGVEAQTS